MIFKSNWTAKSDFRPNLPFLFQFPLMLIIALPLTGAPLSAYAQSPLTDPPSPLKFILKQIPLPPSRPAKFEPINPIEAPKSDRITPEAPKSALQPLTAPDLSETNVAAPLQKLPPAAAQSLFADIPLPPERPKDLAPAEPSPVMPTTIEKMKAAHIATPKFEPITELPKDEVVKRASASLSEMTRFQTEFMQIDGSGRKVNGHLAVVRPGRLRFDYEAPSNVVVIADGNNVGVIDRKLKTRDVYSLFLTPLKFLLKSTIDLKNDISIVDVRSDAEDYVIVAEDKSTFSGTSKIALSFDKRTLQIKQWTVTDPQGYDTTVILGPIDTGTEPDPDLFVIPERVG